MATFILVHGAWHGGWCWRDVAPALRRAGHEVHTPTLAGSDLAAHIDEVLTLVKEDAVLVGHSYAGMVITGAADRSPRVKRLVYLDAFVPENGKCALDYVVPERAARMREEGERTGFIAPPPPSVWGLTGKEGFDFVKQPFATLAQPIHYERKRWRTVPKTYIYCSSPATGSFDQFAAKYRSDPAWRFHELKTGHDAMLLVPGELVSVLLAP